MVTDDMPFVTALGVTMNEARGIVLAVATTGLMDAPFVTGRAVTGRAVTGSEGREGTNPGRGMVDSVGGARGRGKLGGRTPEGALMPTGAATAPRPRPTTGRAGARAPNMTDGGAVTTPLGAIDDIPGLLTENPAAAIPLPPAVRAAAVPPDAANPLGPPGTDFAAASPLAA